MSTLNSKCSGMHLLISTTFTSNHFSSCFLEQGSQHLQRAAIVCCQWRGGSECTNLFHNTSGIHFNHFQNEIGWSSLVSIATWRGSVSSGPWLRRILFQLLWTFLSLCSAQICTISSKSARDGLCRSIRWKAFPGLDTESFKMAYGYSLRIFRMVPSSVTMLLHAQWSGKSPEGSGCFTIYSSSRASTTLHGASQRG